MTTIHPGRYSRESGPVREMLMTFGGFAILLGLIGLGTTIGGGFIIIVLGGLICWSASTINQRHVVRW